MLEKVYVDMNGPLKEVLMSDQKESYRENLSFREYLNGCVQDVGRNMNCKHHSYEISDRNEGLIYENCTRGDSLL